MSTQGERVVNIQCKKDNIFQFRTTKPNKIFEGMASDMFKQFFLLLRTYFDMFIDFVFSLYWERQRQPIPGLEKKHSMLSESAVDLASKIRNKQLTSEELVQACIERINIVNPILNAVTDERFEDALKEAREVDKVIEAGQADFEKQPFLGVPFTAKESHAVCGMLHTLGISVRREERAQEDAECVRLLRLAGAIPLAVTNVPEINKQETRNMVFGQTCNPYHTGRTVGGSSGGEAALAAALASPISLCSDIGGSTRMPAFYCGLFALNPTAGTTSLKGSALRSGREQTMASIGFLSKHCADLAPLTRLVLTETARAHLQLDTHHHIKDIKIFYCKAAHDLRVSPLDKDMLQTMDKVVAALREDTSSEHPPRPYQHRALRHMFTLWRHGMAQEADSFPTLLTNNQGHANGLLELLKKVVGVSRYTLAAILKLLDEQVLPPVDRDWADRTTRELREDLLSTLGEEGVLLFPSAPAAAPYHYTLYLRPFNFSYWAIFNALKFPAAQVPVGVNSAGVPLGLQVVAAPRREALCLAVANHLEARFGGFVPPCTLHPAA
ncbi:Fatty-acid amide hydrolase 2 [Papilio xuthus]|uniref:Fatty-acid amide hydrolase 2 n=1 Tax=Papilio xuthus TaxID=66420 RepID=A0A0N0P9X0_PAPXU|nr:Fatty-acid amide hydrolase 2 [Papilio xuthus]